MPHLWRLRSARQSPSDDLIQGPIVPHFYICNKFVQYLASQYSWPRHGNSNHNAYAAPQTTSSFVDLKLEIGVRRISLRSSMLCEREMKTTRGGASADQLCCSPQEFVTSSEQSILRLLMDICTTLLHNFNIFLLLLRPSDLGLPRLDCRLPPAPLRGTFYLGHQEVVVLGRGSGFEDVF